MQRLSKEQIYILFFLFGIFIILLGFSLSYFEQKSEIEKDFINDSKKTLAFNERFIKSRIRHHQRELETISKSPFVLDLIQDSKTGNERVHQIASTYLLDLTQAHDDMMQVRYIDNSGDEIIRVDRKELGSKPKIVSSEKLQNKKDRYYFQQIMNVEEDVVWYSEIDLNVEYGKIQEPYTPTLRVGIPVFINKNREGMLIVNIFMKDLLQKLERADNYRLYLCDNKGNFLLHPHSMYNWSKYLNKEYTLYDEFPKLASQILGYSSSSHQGVFSKELDFGQSEKYYLIVKLNKEILDDEKQDIIKTSLVLGVFVMLISFPFGLVVVRQVERLSSRLSAIIDSLGDGIFILDKQNQTSYINNKALDIVEYSAHELIGKRNHKLLEHGDAEGDYIESEDCPIHNVNQTRQQYHTDDNTFVTKSGRRINVEYTTTPFFINDHFEGSITIFRDITQRKRIEKEIVRLSTVIDQIDDLVTITDVKGRITYVNEAFCTFTGYSREDALGETPRLYKSGKHSIEEIKALWVTILEGNIYRGVMINKKKNGELFYEEKTITPLTDERGKIMSFVSTGKDITKRVEMEVELEKLATTDHLTGLFNRFKFEEIFAYEMLRSRRYNTPLSLIMFDIDHFKKINDTYGHDVGDSVLKEISELVRLHVRESDTLARWGGEEFMLLTPQVGIDSAYELAENLRKAVSELDFDRVGHVNCSLGVAQLEDDESCISICKRVDMALYKAKERGRNKTVKT